MSFTVAVMPAPSLRSDQALFLEKEKRSGFIGCIVGNCNFSSISDGCQGQLCFPGYTPRGS